jgi:hypothetical protein
MAARGVLGLAAFGVIGAAVDFGMAPHRHSAIQCAPRKVH